MRKFLRIGVKSGKADTIKDKELLSNAFCQLPDGDYFIDITSAGLKSKRDYQNLYFLLLETVSKNFGEQKYDLHETFKQEYKIQTSKELVSEEKWRDFIEKFKWWIYANYDFIL